MVDRCVTVLLFCITWAVQAAGCVFLRLTGCSWFGRESGFQGGAADESPHCLSFTRMDTFFAGLVVWPVLFSLLVAAVLQQWLVSGLAVAAIGIPLVLWRYFEKNVFIPFFGGLVFLLSVVIALLLHCSMILVLFLFYLGAVMLAPLFLVFFLSTI